MKADLRTGGGDEGGDLRSFLREWDVLSPPPEIEEDLRRTFRRRRAKGRPALWLSIAAAALALLALWRIGREDRAATPAPTERPVAAVSPALPPPETVETGRPRSAAPAAGEPSSPAPVAQRHRRQTPAPREAAVIVEPGQARLLVELGQQLRDVRQAAPGTSIRGIGGTSAAPATIGVGEQTDVPVYRGEWETLAGEWPYVHRSRPGR
jgi:hypothetical protein